MSRRILIAAAAVIALAAIGYSAYRIVGDATAPVDPGQAAVGTSPPDLTLPEMPPALACSTLIPPLQVLTDQITRHLNSTEVDPAAVSRAVADLKRVQVLNPPAALDADLAVVTSNGRTLEAYLAGSGKPLTEGVTFQEAGLRVTDFCQRNG